MTMSSLPCLEMVKEDDAAATAFAWVRMTPLGCVIWSWRGLSKRFDVLNVVDLHAVLRSHSIQDILLGKTGELGTLA
ncbi:hypothetical protein KC356_g180 [Hortaea werneckii]|nr:hypothetical protein KC356_g180 [Hortaea werneckii]